MLYAHLNSTIDINEHLHFIQTSLVEKSDIWWVSILKEQSNITSINEIIKVLKQIGNEKNQKLSNIRLVVNDTTDLSKLKNLDGIKVTSINFYRMLTYYYKYHAKYQEHPHNIDQQFNNEFTGKKNKVLFLMGKPYQPHRTPILVELINRNLKDKLIYSWNPGRPGSEVFNSVKDIVTRAFEDKIDFNKFVQLHTCWLDIPENFPILNAEETCYHYTGFPFDASLYNDTSLSIVSETDHVTTMNVGFPWTTEKLWRAIANHHPFVLIGDCKIIAKLRKLGYETWDSFLKHDQYEANRYWNNIDRKAIEMTVDNIEYFVSNNKCIDTIKQLVKKNSELMDQQTCAEIDETFDGDYDVFRTFMKNSKYLNLSEGKAIADINKNSI